MTSDQIAITLMLAIVANSIIALSALAGWLKANGVAGKYIKRTIELNDRLIKQVEDTIAAQKSHVDSINNHIKQLKKFEETTKIAERLILQLPENHEGRNSWLLNHGTSKEAQQAQLKNSSKIAKECSVVVAMERREPALATTDCKHEGCTNQVVAYVDMWCDEHIEKDCSYCNTD